MTSPGRPRLAIDCGQTGARVRISDHTAGDPVVVELPGVRTDQPVVPQVADIVASALQGRTLPDAELAAGVSGLTPGATRPDELLTASAKLGVTRVALAHDSVTSFLAANRLEPGAVVAAGTGVVTLGSGTATAKVDGWGMFGDDGSGYWIGRQGVAAALRAFDGRGPTTSLTGLAEKEFGALPEIYMVVQADPLRVRRTAGFAKVVAAAADAGDEVARGILDGAAAELATSIGAALRGAGWRSGDKWRVSWMGKVVTTNPRLRAKFCELVTGAHPGVTTAEPYGIPLDGASLLLDLPADHPIAPLVAYAGA
ncbi:MAG: BadF/BadG/BcrA/BcrD ATPase family protein [Gordonia sp. (in: high G+C Gram-positive bacteria)]|uniref:BadF/BadG/BcrA/BcrD ATPase family protein n=1 Tax=Gordonia sp. (in: high G+C Gram-positive bacteria) TaxID=84139 RepID=UPI0039E67429